MDFLLKEETIFWLNIVSTKQVSQNMQNSQLLSLIAPLILALMMLGMGLSLTVNDFSRLFIKPKAVLLGVGLQTIALPVTGYFLLIFSGLTAELAVGFMLLVACPGGPGSNLVSYICRGDAALSVTLTAISSLLAVITIPLVVNFSIAEFMQAGHVNISVLKTVLAVLFITLVPLSLGMVIARRFPAFAAAAEQKVKFFSILFLLALVFYTFYKERNHLSELIQQVGLLTILLCILTLLIGFLVSRMLGFNSRIQKTIAIEVGIQNSALAIVVAGSILQSNLMAVPAAMYSPVMISASLMFLLYEFWFRFIKRRRTDKPAPSAA
ncbi:MAG: bile acid:sodium symporter family protein [Deltaproteobacteria bacterium]|nr:bile acid:sodium symporter family protein [Deltaproteobacteria bacterium]